VAEGDSAAVSFVLMLNAKTVPALLLKKVPPASIGFNQKLEPI
jgi:hypothetical protein